MSLFFHIFPSIFRNKFTSAFIFFRVYTFTKLLFYNVSGADSDYRNVWNLKNFVSEKSGKRCEKMGEILWKIGEYLIKSGNRAILRRFIFSCIRAWCIMWFNLIVQGSINFNKTSSSTIFEILKIFPLKHQWILYTRI